VDGFVSIGNSTGITDTGTAQTSYNNVFLAKNIGFDLFFLDEGRYSLTNALVLSSAQNPMLITDRSTGDCQMKMDHVLLRRLVEPRVGGVAQRAVLEAKNCTFEGMDVKVTGAARWENCLINGKSFPMGKSTTGADVPALLQLTPKDFKP
jgi:hypothetical protein